MNTIHRYQVQLENHGEIDVTYNLVPSDSQFYTKFKFSPSYGLLKVKQVITIDLSFCSDILGEFVEEFNFQLAVSL